MLFPGPLWKPCLGSSGAELIPNAPWAAKETAGSLWLTHFGHDLILYYHFSFLLQCFKKPRLDIIFVLCTFHYYLRNTSNSTGSYKRNYPSLTAQSHPVRREHHHMSLYPNTHTHQTVLVIFSVLLSLKGRPNLMLLKQHFWKLTT